MVVLDRRSMLQSVTAMAASAALGGRAPSEDRLVGIQVGAVSFVDEGTDAVLDLFQKVGVNALFLATFTYGRGIAGRQVPGQPFPDHGKQESDERTFRGGSYARVHDQFYRKTALRKVQAPDFKDFDLLAEVVPRAHKRGMKVYSWYEDVFARDVENIEKLQES